MEWSRLTQGAPRSGGALHDSPNGRIFLAQTPTTEVVDGSAGRRGDILAIPPPVSLR